jgi:hypothetical protein
MFELSYFCPRRRSRWVLSVGRGCPRHGQSDFVTLTREDYDEMGHVAFGEMLWRGFPRPAPAGTVTGRFVSRKETM